MTLQRGKSLPNTTFDATIANLMLYPKFLLKSSPEFKPISLEKVKKVSIKKAKLSEFGPWDERPMSETIEIVNNSDYSPLGKFIAYDFFVRRCMTKLRITDFIKSSLEFQKYSKENPVKRPLFVLGMPRTGTSFLHKLLSLDPSTRSPLTYELYDPIPRISNDLELDKKKRIQFLQKNIQNIEKYAPQIMQSHEISATNVEECITAMGNDIPILFETFHTLLPHVDQILEWDWTIGYENYYKILQILEFLAKDKKRWVLKSPLHLMKLETLFKIFPTADIIWTHRTQSKVLFSFADLMRANSDFLMYDEIDLFKIGEGVTHYAEVMTKRGHEFLNSSDKNCLHVKYEEFIPDPISTVKNIYQTLGYEFSKEYQEILEKYLENDKNKRRELRKKDNRIPATLATYGLDEAMLKERLGWYEDIYVKSSNTEKMKNGTN